MNNIFITAFFLAICFLGGCGSSVKDPGKEAAIMQQYEDRVSRLEERVGKIEKSFREHEKVKVLPVPNVK